MTAESPKSSVWFKPPQPSTVPRPVLEDPSSATSSSIDPASPDVGRADASKTQGGPGDAAAAAAPAKGALAPAAGEMRQTREAIVEAMAAPKRMEPSRAPPLGDVVLSACNELYADVLQCMHSGSWWDKTMLCQSQAARFWKCADDYKYVLRRLGYKQPIVSDQQREIMAREAVRIVREAWALENDGQGRPDLAIDNVDELFLFQAKSKSSPEPSAM